MAKKLIVIMANSDPGNPEELGTPLVQAAVAAAMDYQVEVICAGTAGKLLKKGIAERLTVKPGAAKTVYDFIREAHAMGARFYACPANLDLFDMTAADLIPECDGLLGAA
jgi:predicted peroxiredoxin